MRGKLVWASSNAELFRVRGRRRDQASSNHGGLTSHMTDEPVDDADAPCVSPVLPLSVTPVEGPELASVVETVAAVVDVVPVVADVAPPVLPADPGPPDVVGSPEVDPDSVPVMLSSLPVCPEPKNSAEHAARAAIAANIGPRLTSRS
jgi:hypothetical protein